MFESDKKIYIQETEVKPNTYATYVVIACFFGMLICWILTEVGIFRTDKTVTRIGVIVPLIMVISLLIALAINRQLFYDPKTKYVIMIITSIFTLAITVLLTFHTTMMCLFPIFIAMLYRSRSIGRIAVIASLFCTIISPILGYLLSTWDIPLFEELILIGTNATIEYFGASNDKTLESILKILLYISFPRTITVGACSLLLAYIIRLGETNVRNQILVNEISHRDTITGLFNQNYLEEVISKAPKEGTVGIIFFDVNGLKELNDSKGHEAGNDLLELCGDSIRNVTDDETSAGFRAGGDEFLIMMPNADEKDVLEKIDEWKMSLASENEKNRRKNNGIIASVACGYDFGRMRDIDQIIKHADSKMYKNKAEMKKRMTM